MKVRHIFTLIFCLCIFACNQPEVYMSGGRTHFKEARFSIELPNGWYIFEHPKYNEIEVINMDNFDGAAWERISIWFHEHNETRSLEKIIENDTRYLDENPVDLYYSVITCGTSLIDINGIRTSLILLTHIPDEAKKSFTNLTYRFAIENWEYSIDLFLETDSLSNYLTVFEECIESFRFEYD